MDHIPTFRPRGLRSGVHLLTVRLSSGIALLMAFACFAATHPAMAQGSDAKTMVAGTVTQVLDILKDHQTPEAERRQKLIGTVEPHFDFADMAKSSLGYHWRELNPGQQAQFTQLFTAFMEDAYLSKIEGFSNQHIEFLDQHATDANDVEVSSRVVTPGQSAEPVKVDYMVGNRGGDWKVYDVMVDGVSITANYRNQFNRVVNNQGFDALMNAMRSKQQELLASLGK